MIVARSLTDPHTFVVVEVFEDRQAAYGSCMRGSLRTCASTADAVRYP